MQKLNPANQPDGSIRYGLGVTVATAKGWALVGGRTTKNHRVALRHAQTIHRLMMSGE